MLNFYRTGKLHVTDEMCVLAFKVNHGMVRHTMPQEDLEFWGIPEFLMESCCGEKLAARLGLLDDEMEGEASKLILDDEEDFGAGGDHLVKHENHA